MPMSEEGQMIADVAQRILGDVPMATYDATEAGEWPTELWGRIEEAGLPLALVGDEAGGFGLPLADGLEIVRMTGAVALPVPLAETMVANWLLASAGVAIEPGPVTFTDTALAIEGNRLTGRANAVPWARQAATVALAADPTGNRLVRIARSTLVSSALNIAGEPRDTIGLSVSLDECPNASSALSAFDLHLVGAAMRSLQLAGAIEATMAMTLAYVQERSQFGRALGAFQVIQHQIAQLAGETAAARVAADMVCEAMTGELSEDAIATAKIRTGEAASRMAAVAHQLHGAMGFTREYRLHLFTRRLWAWRDEFGGESAWSAALGRRLASHSTEIWPAITRI